MGDLTDRYTIKENKGYARSSTHGRKHPTAHRRRKYFQHFVNLFQLKTRLTIIPNKGETGISGQDRDHQVGHNQEGTRKMSTKTRTSH